MNNQTKAIKRRVMIGWVIFSILLIVAIQGYIPYTLVFMISIPMMSVITVINGMEDENSEDNMHRIMTLGAVLFFLSFSYYMNLHEIQNNISEALKDCYAFSDDTTICDQMNQILNPEPLMDDE